GLALDLGGAWLDALVERNPLFRSETGARLALDAELALSAPNPNRDDVAYLDDFDASDEVPLDVRRQQWKLGSAPDSRAGDDGTFPLAFNAATAAPLVWQHDIAAGGVITGNLLPARDIDRQIRVAGTPLPEPVMWLTFGGPNGGAPQPPPGTPRWRSITTVLSTTGRDMSRSEFIEFYARADAAGAIALVLDVGTVSE